MEKSIDSLSVLFDKIYSAFILRDVAGKIIPGLLLLMPILFLFSLNSEHNLEVLLKLNFGLWFLFIILLWIIGYVVQSFGEVFGLISYSLSLEQDSSISSKRYFWSPFIKYYIVNLESMLEAQKVAYTQENNSNSLKYIERLAAIREACGNSGSSLILAIPIYLYYFYITNTYNQISIVFMLIVLIFIFLLIRMHREHSYRYWYSLSNITHKS